MCVFRLSVTSTILSACGKCRPVANQRPLRARLRRHSSRIADACRANNAEEVESRRKTGRKKGPAPSLARFKSYFRTWTGPAELFPRKRLWTQYLQALLPLALAPRATWLFSSGPPLKR